MPKKPELGRTVRMNFGILGERPVVFYTEDGSYGLLPNEKTEALRAMLEEVYADAMPTRVRL